MELGLELPDVMRGLSYLRMTLEASAGLTRYSCVVGRTVDAVEQKSRALTTLTTVGKDNNNT